MIRWMIMSTLATGLFYALYLWLFRRDRWFDLSRAYLFIILGFCSMFPWFQLPASVMSSTPATEFLMTVDNPETYVVGNIPMEEPELSLKLDIIPSIYFGGVALMLAILIIQLTAQAVRIRRLRREYPVYGRANGFDIPKGALLILVPDNTEPYSFFKHIVVGTHGLDEEEMRCILAHESVHVSRNHSIDIVCMRLVCCVMWFNPFAWMMLHELRAVHEYQADAAVADGDNKDYLRLLYRQTTGFGYGHITNKFNSINIKKRIVMMNKTKSRFGAWKMLAALPVAALLMMVGCKPATVEKADTKEAQMDEATVVEDDTIYETLVHPVEVDPEFPGGNEALYKYLAQNIKYPEKAKADKIEGRVVVGFVIEKDGSISNAEVRRSVNAEMDAEALRVINAMPKWQPGTMEGKPVRVHYNIPITFKLR